MPNMPTDANGPLLVSPKRAAELLDVSREYVYQLCSSGALKSVALKGNQRSRRIHYTSLLEFIEAQPTEPNVA